VFIAPETKDTLKYGAMCALIIEMGPLCFQTDKFLDATGKRHEWYKVGDWVMIGKYAGSKFDVSGTEMRIFNDDEILAKVPDPTIIKRFSI